MTVIATLGLAQGRKGTGPDFTAWVLDPSWFLSAHYLGHPVLSLGHLEKKCEELEQVVSKIIPALIFDVFRICNLRGGDKLTQHLYTFEGMLAEHRKSHLHALALTSLYRLAVLGGTKCQPTTETRV